MGADTEQLRRDIEQTRRELTYDADALTEKVSPSRIVDRRVTKAKGAFGNVRDKVMGTASNTASSGQSAVSSLTDGTTDLAQSARARAEGNPLAAGVIAFGVGWLVSALIPASTREQEAAGQLVESVKQHSQPVTEELSGIATEVKDNMSGPAQEAAHSVQATATDAAQAVQEHGRSAAQDVQADARYATEEVRSTNQSGQYT
ncbi:MAG: DUF3618 domain-containing protein [Geodermatophilaceae bacterium]|nr:DUF3618 domain-containing protein [Geodermatophilaceae bacterium]